MPTSRVHERCGCAASRAATASSSAARPFAFPHCPRNFERDRPFRTQHTALQIEIDLEKKSVHGKARIDVVRIDSQATEVTFDAVAFSIASVMVEGKPTTFRYDGRSLTVPVGNQERASIEVNYSARPRRGMYFLAPDEHYPLRPQQVWTQCQEEDARHFFPCHDKPHMKMTFEVEATVKEGFRVLSNGELVSEKTPKGSKWTFHWKMNQALPSYLVSIVAGDFDITETHAGDVPLSYWIPKPRAADTSRTFDRTPEMVTYFGKLLGVNFPWNKYAQVVVSDFIFGGMENTTATTMYEHIMLDERAALDITSDDLIAHELAHHWFGDFVTCRDWSEGWLNEGFATYLEHAWREHHHGNDEYEYGLKTDLDAYVGEAHGRYRRAIVCSDYDSPLDLFDRHLYEKGALVLHSLRTLLGKEIFYQGVSAYLKKHAGGLVETKDLMRALEDASGKSLGRVFDQLVFKPGHVELEVTLAWENQLLTLSAKQHQQATDGVPSTFDTPLVIDIVDEDGKSERHTLQVSGRAEVLALPCKARPAFVVVDPEMRILGEVTIKAPLDMLRNQLKSGASARARWLAANALSKNDDPVTITALAERLDDQNEFWGVRAESAEALGKIRGHESFLELAKRIETTHPKVRRAIVAALGNFKTSEAALTLKPLALRDASYMTQAEAARSLGKTRQAVAHDVLVELLSRPSWGEVIRMAALDGLAASRDERAVPHLLAAAKIGHPTRARRSAILAIPKLSQDRRAREALEDLLDDGDPYLRVDVARALGELGDGKARSALKTRLEVDLDPRVRRRIREVLRDLGDTTKRSNEHLREELDKLQNEHAELKTRLAKLEARSLGSSPQKAVKPLPKKKRG